MMRQTLLPVLAWILCVACWVGAQEPSTVLELPLWPQGPPSDNGLSGEERVANQDAYCVGNISQPTISVYLPRAPIRNGTAVVITPGGGYGVVCIGSEGRKIADLLNERGIAAIVVKYRLPNQHHLIPADDARRAIRTVRHHAPDWHIDPNKVGVWGFSAGGHLASTVSTAFDSGNADASDMIERQSSRPDFSILFYPVISMEPGVTHGGSRENLLGANPPAALVERYTNEDQVGKETPPTFLLHCGDDRAVPVENSLRYYRSLVAAGVPADLQIFENGGHGPGAFESNPTWITALEGWLRRRECF